MPASRACAMPRLGWLRYDDDDDGALLVAGLSKSGARDDADTNIIMIFFSHRSFSLCLLFFFLFLRFRLIASVLDETQLVVDYFAVFFFVENAIACLCFLLYSAFIESFAFAFALA